MSAESNPKPDRLRKEARRLAGIALAGLLTSCGGGVGVPPHSLIDRPEPENWEAEDSSEEELIDELLQRTQRQPCSVPSVVATRTVLFGPEAEAVIADLDELARLLCDRGVEGVSVGWGADGEPLILPGGETARFDDLLVLAGPLEEVYHHSGSFGRAGIACGGRVPRSPDLTVYLSESGGAQVTLVSDADAFLWSRSPSGEDQCTNLGASDEAAVLLAGEPGTHQVWVGSLEGESTDWTLRVENPLTAVGPTRTWTPGTGGGVRIPVEIGSYSTSPPSSGGQFCTGYIGQGPTFELYVPAAAYGFISVEAAQDSVLYIEGPDGAVLCNDDYVDHNAGISSYFAAGVWQVYVGSYSSHHAFSATVSLN